MRWNILGGVGGGGVDRFGLCWWKYSLLSYCITS
jgi:hypothetical protein